MIEELAALDTTALDTGATGATEELEAKTVSELCA